MLAVFEHQHSTLLMVARPDDRFAETTAEESNGSAVIEVDRDNPPLRGRLAAAAQPIEVYNRSSTSVPVVGLGWNRALRIVGAPFFTDTALGAGGLLPADPGADVGPLAGAHYVSPIGPWVQRIEPDTGGIWWQAGGLLLQPGQEYNLRLLETVATTDTTGHAQYPDALRASVRVRLRPSVVVVPVNVVVVGRSGGGNGNRLGWRDFQPAELLAPGVLLRYARAWFDGDTVQAPVITHRNRPPTTIETSALALDPRSSFNGSEAQVFDLNAGAREEAFDHDMNMEIDSVWQQCGIQFRLASYNEYLADDDCSSLRSCRPGPQEIQFRGLHFDCDDQPSLLSRLGNTPVGLRVIFSDRFRTAAGENCAAIGETLFGFVSPRNREVAAIALTDVLFSERSGYDTRRTTIAHELGHSLTLEHIRTPPGEPGNVMEQFETSGRYLNAAQCGMARARACQLAGVSPCPKYP